MELINTYNTSNVEYFKLRLFVNEVNEELDRLEAYDLEMTLNDVYFDISQDWKYTSPITWRNGLDSWQSLNPRDYKLLLTCDSFDKIMKSARYYANKLVEGKISIDLDICFE